MSKCKCKFCGSEHGDTRMQGYCQGCYKYFVTDKKKIYPTYVGDIRYTKDGDVICPECGKAFRKLGGHIWQAHHISVKDFFDKYGWNYRKTKASNSSYRKHMKDIQHPKSIWINLIDKGKNSRFNRQNTGNPMAVNTLVVNHRCKDCCYFSNNYCAKHNKECKFIIGCKENNVLTREGD